MFEGEVGLSNIDPIAFELIRNALAAVVDDMTLTVVRTSYSSNLKNSMDFSTGFLNASGELVVQGLCLPLHLGSLPDAMAAVLNKYEGHVCAEDVFILNDPFEGGSHLPDIYIFKPVFIGQELLGFVATIAHHSDVGGKVAGGNACDCTEIYQEGLRLPPLKLYEAGRRVDAIFQIIAKNVRVPHKVMGDLRAQLAACHIGERGLKKLAQTHGTDNLLFYVTALMDYSERLARAEIAAWNDGTYEFTDYIDDDGIDPNPVPIQVALTVDGDRLSADFSGTARQVKGGINAPLPFTKSAVYACVRSIMEAEIPTNSGFFRAIGVDAPAGSLVNPVLPAAVAARGLTGFRLANAIMGCLAQIAPQKVPACEVGGDTGISMGGYGPNGEAFVLLEFLFSGWGGRPHCDGIDGVASIVVNFSNNPVEVLETEYPLRIRRYGFVPDSGGPGQYRGGLAVVREYEFTGDEAVLQIRSDRRKHRPYGLAGGRPGTPSLNILNPDHEHRVLESKVLLNIHKGDVLRHILAGPGGYGDPRDRDPQLVAADVRNEKIGLPYAEREYGVVIDPRTLQVDQRETDRLRTRMSAVQEGPEGCRSARYRHESKQ